MKDNTLRTAVADWVNYQIEEVQAVHVPTLARDALAHFEQDAEFVRQFFGLYGYQAIYEQVRSCVERTRGGWVPMGDEVVSRDELKVRAVKLSSRWESWLEHCGDRHINIMTATKADLLMAVAERRGRAATELGYASLYEQMADKLQPGETVSDRFTTEDIETLYQAVAIEGGNNGHLRRDGGSVHNVPGSVTVQGQADGGHTQGPEDHRGMATKQGRHRRRGGVATSDDAHTD